MILPSERLFKELLVDFRYEFTQKELNDVEEGIYKYNPFMKFSYSKVLE